MVRSAFLALSAATLALSFGGTASAGTKEDVAACHKELTEKGQDKYGDAVYTFKSVSGGALRKLVFEVISGEERNSVVCKVRRGDVVELDWAGK